MKRSKILLFMLIILLVPSLTCCSSPSAQLRNTFSVYLDVISKDIPEDMQLTIYYIDPLTLTRRPLSTDDLVNSPDKKIVVKHEELSTQIALLSKLEPSILEPVKEETYLNARLYYVIETETHGKILEVAMSEIGGRNVFVNGIEVEDNSVFYEVITPFLSEEDIAILSRTFSGETRDIFRTGDGSLS